MDQQPVPPPLPPRPGQDQSAFGCNGGFGQNVYNNSGYGMGFCGFGSGMYNQGMHGTGYGGFNQFNNYSGTGVSPESNFVRIAEEQSRSAFQSIESVVNAVASVANMLSSTHNAVFSSFRAVIGVVEQFTLLKGQLEQFLFVTIYRFLKKLWRTILVHLGLVPVNYNNANAIWDDIQNRRQTAGEFLPGNPNRVGFNWAVAIFWLIALGGPYLIYKAVSKMVTNVEESRKWATGNHEHYSAKALYDFNAASSHELSFCADDILRVAPKSKQPQLRGWLLASSGDGQQVGLIPINYVKLLRRQSASPPTIPVSPLDEAEPPSTRQHQSLLPALNSSFKN